MCGICGLVTVARERLPSRECLDAALSLLRHRGPDDSGVYLSPEGPPPHAALGHRRLSIIDLATGRQPMPNEDETVWVIFNGEIYNFPELRRELEGAGHQFRTRSDTEVIVHAYEAYGETFVKRLDGMFAFGLWDEKAKRLILARDRLGKKPLFWAGNQGVLAFGSLPKVLFALGALEPRLDPAALDAFLAYQYVPHPLSLYEGVRKIPPAHYLVYEQGQVRIERYWQVPSPPAAGIQAEGVEGRLRATIKDAVRRRLVSDVPLGAFLSGGIDSTIVVGLMAEILDRPVETFSIGFEDPVYNELEYARLAARTFRTVHHEWIVRPDAAALLPALADHFDEPFADSSAIPTFYLAQRTREVVKVALTGDGGDECFGGYRRYRALRSAARLSRFAPGVQSLAHALLSRIPGRSHSRGILGQTTRFFAGAGKPLFQRYYLWMSAFDDEHRSRLYTPAFREQTAASHPFEFMERYLKGMEGLDPMKAAMGIDLQTYLPDDLLVKVDIATMANSLEARSPFLDPAVVELAASFPSGWNVRGWHGKHLLRRAFADLLPPAIRTRGKMGFGVPIARWLRTDLRPFMEERLRDGWGIRSGRFSPGAVHGLIEDHVRGREDCSARLWTLLVLEEWAARYPNL